MKRIIGIIAFLCVFGMSGLMAQEVEEFCPMGETEQQKILKNKASFLGDGLYLTAKGELKVLVVFARFPNDVQNLQGNWWNAGQDPSSTVLNTIIDADTSVNSNNLYNLTNYFKQMSLGEFDVIGEAISVEAPKTAASYGNNLGVASKDVIKYISDNNLVNFSQYDNWTQNGVADHTNAPDGLVDMIMMVWKGSNFVPGSNWGGCAAMYQTSGCGGSSLLDPGTLVVNGGKSVEFGFGIDAGSGTTSFAYYDVRVAFNIMKHEIAHWLLGGGHPYPSNGVASNRVASLLAASHSRSMSVNASERERLGWGDPIPEITNKMIDVQIGDFLTTGDAYKYKLVNGSSSEYFYIENHKKLSIYDDATKDSQDKGIFILHTRFASSNTSSIRYLNSDGDWNWANVSPYSITDACCGTVPLFGKIDPNPESGENFMTKIFADNYDNNWHWLHGFKDELGNEDVSGYYRGQELISMDGSFNRYYRSIFGPHTNPKSKTWTGVEESFGMRVKGETSSTITVDFEVSYDPYNITENTTWDGQIFLNNTVTVQAGAKLTIKPNTTVYVADNKSIHVYGELEADRSTFTAMNNDWYGITFMAGSDGDIKKNVIEKVQSFGGAAIRVYTNNHFEIRGNTIQNVYGITSGISLSNADNTYIYENHIENATNYGIYAYNSNGRIFNNFIKNSSVAGIYSGGSSSVLLSAVTSPYYSGKNTIAGGKYGLQIAGSSYLHAGSSSSFASQNRIANQNGSGWAHIYSSSPYANYAQYNYFKPYNGSGGVAPTVGGSGTVYTTPYLTTDPDPGAGFKQMNVGYEEEHITKEQRQITDAFQLRMLGKFKEAVVILNTLLKTSQTSEIINQSLFEYSWLARQSKEKTFLSELESLQSDFVSTVYEPIAKISLARGYYSYAKYDEALTLIERLLEKYEGSAETEQAVILATHIAAEAGYLDKAKMYYDLAKSVKSKLYNGQALLELNDYLEMVAGKSIELESNQLINENPIQIPIYNYPNPFNPETVIKFTLPVKGKVTIKVYDLLGREVAVLVNGVKEQGSHSVRFNGAAVASGIYIYRLQAGDQVITKRMTLIK